MVAFNRCYENQIVPTPPDFNARGADCNLRPKTSMPEYHRRDLIALAWGVSLLVAGMLGWIARGNQ